MACYRREAKGAKVICEVMAVWPLCFRGCLLETLGRGAGGASGRESGSFRANALCVNTETTLFFPHLCGLLPIIKEVGVEGSHWKL